MPLEIRLLTTRHSLFAIHCVDWRRGPDSNLRRLAGVRARCRNPEHSRRTSTDPLSIRSFVWRRGPDSNRRIKVLQTSPLPLGYRASLVAPHHPLQQGRPAASPIREGNMERETGFEPATSTLARSHSTAELLPLVRRQYTAPPKSQSTGGHVFRVPT